MEADLLFDKDMVRGIRLRNYHELDLDGYFNRIFSEVTSYMRRSPNIVISQAIYRERYRKFLYECFAPEVRFVWVYTPNFEIQKSRVDMRATGGSMINSEVIEYMSPYWEQPEIPHYVLNNDENLNVELEKMMKEFGVYFSWED
ncbi:MAG: hypothetical protein OEY93_05790 [Anaerolineae bacterium]|nr:hypothetical protein [Anaerolineae bacterium]